MIAKWEHLTWEDIATKASSAIPVLVTGSVEQHGKHLPLGTDILIPLGLLERLDKMHGSNSGVKNLILMPPVSYTPARHSNWLPGTVNLSGSTLTSMIYDLLVDLSRQGLPRVFIFNGHMESAAFIIEGIHLALKQHAGITALLLNWWELVSEELIQEIFGDSWPGWEAEHAALTETSLMLALAPELVNMAKAEFSPNFTFYPYTVFPQPPEVRPPTGAYARLDKASGEIGEKIADHIIARMLPLLEKWFPGK